MKEIRKEIEETEKEAIRAVKEAVEAERKAKGSKANIKWYPGRSSQIIHIESVELWYYSVATSDGNKLARV